MQAIIKIIRRRQKLVLFAFIREAILPPVVSASAYGKYEYFASDNKLIGCAISSLSMTALLSWFGKLCEFVAATGSYIGPR